MGLLFVFFFWPCGQSYEKGHPRSMGELSLPGHFKGCGVRGVGSFFPIKAMKEGEDGREKGAGRVKGPISN